MSEQLKSTITTIQNAHRIWWGGLIPLLLLAAWLNFTGYDYGLPYIERPNEAQNLAEIYIWRGLFDVEEEKPGYPPGILGVYYGAQLAYETAAGESALARPDRVMSYVRFSAAITNILTALVVALGARMLAGNLGGWLAGFAWVSFPLVTQWTLVGHPQAWETLFYALAFYWAALTLKKQQPLYALLSTAAAVGAVIFKYPAFPVLGFGTGVVLWQLYRQPEGRRVWFPALIRQFILIFLCAVWLVFLYDAGRMTGFEHAETEVFTGGGVFNMLNPVAAWSMLLASLNQIAFPVWVFLPLVIVGSIIIWRAGDEWERVSWFLLLGLTLFSIWFLTSYLRWDDPTRHTTPFSGLLAILIAAALIRTMGFISQRIKQPLILPAVTITAAFLWIAPPLSSSIEIAQQRAIPITQAGLATWSADALGDGAILVDNNNLRTFTREWGGYTGPLRAWVYRDISENDLADWREIDVNYAQLTPGKVESLARTDDGAAMLADMLLLKQFPPPDTPMRGDPMLIYRLWDMEQRIEIDLGEQVRLVGYDLSSTQLAPGEPLAFKPYWQAIQQPTTNYNVYLHLVPLDDRVPLAQADGAPASVNRPTSTWTDTSEIHLGTPFTLTLPADIAPGEYRLLVGLYDFQTGVRLLTASGDDFIEIDRITVLSDDT